MKTDLVSVVIPTYNRLYPLAELVESLSRQTYQNFEVIIVNDGGASVQELKKLYSFLHIDIVNVKKNVGHVEARNIGVRRAKGEYIMLMDDDDLLVSSHIERMLKELESADFVFSDVEIFDYDIVNNVRIPKKRTLFAYQYELEGMRKFSTYVPSGSLYRRSLHESVGYFDKDVHHYWDWDFYLRVAACFRIRKLTAATVLYAFSDKGTNQSLLMTDTRKMYLNRLCKKHGLGTLPVRNFWLLLEEADVKKRQMKSNRIWNGEPFVSKLVRST
ncbi:glycosyltransferase family 2 protein [Priestia megaterium]|nr:glycosyltransferase family 2 protein [Priestia megaterium]